MRSIDVNVHWQYNMRVTNSKICATASSRTMMSYYVRTGFTLRTDRVHTMYGQGSHYVRTGFTLYTDRVHTMYGQGLHYIRTGFTLRTDRVYTAI